MKGRKPKPTALRLVEGNREHRPLNNLEPKPPAIAPRCPRHLDRQARKIWRLTTKVMAEMGTLAVSDQAVIAGFCAQYSRWIKAEERLAASEGPDKEVMQTVNGHWIQNPWLGISNRAHDKMVKLAAELGLTPTARTRIRLDKPAGRSRAERLLD